MSSPMYQAMANKYQSLSKDGTDDEEEGSFESPKYSQAENTFINNEMANGRMKKVPYPGINDDEDEK